MIYNIYTDGSCRNNGFTNAIGAWGYITIVDGALADQDWAVQVNGVTNQMMELEAAIQGCSSVYLKLEPLDTVNIYTDSAYLERCYKEKWYEKWESNGWVNSKKQPVANRSQWEDLIPFFKDSRYTFYKVKGHSDNYYNSVVDQMVQEATALVVHGRL